MGLVLELGVYTVIEVSGLWATWLVSGGVGVYPLQSGELQPFGLVCRLVPDRAGWLGLLVA